jgi:hypothetical protein
MRPTGEGEQAKSRLFRRWYDMWMAIAAVVVFVAAVVTQIILWFALANDTFTFGGFACEGGNPVDTVLVVSLIGLVPSGILGWWYFQTRSMLVGVLWGVTALALVGVVGAAAVESYHLGYAYSCD